MVVRKTVVVIVALALGASALGARRTNAAEKRKAAQQNARPVQEVTLGTPESLRLAISDLVGTYGKRYPNGASYLRRLDALEAGMKNAASPAFQAEFLALQRQALLANPLLEFDRILLVRRPLGPKARSAAGGALGLPTLNARTNDTIKRPGTGWRDTIEELSHLRSEARLRVIYRSAQKRIVADMDLHFDGQHIMFSSGDANDQWNLFEYQEGATEAVQLTPTHMPDVGFYDSCYLPDGRIAMTSTACYQGLPCQNGNLPMASLYQLDPRNQKIRQLTFEQDSDWCPTVLNNGRLMYLRWEYTDAPHYFTRVLFSANPDGTAQMAYYGSNSYFPNAFFYARPLPGHATQVIGIVGGHHGVARAGRLMILAPAQGRFEAQGVVQEIPGRGKTVEPQIKDRLVNDVWPQFLHPYPLSEKYHLVSMKKDPQALWGVYLVDVFDNLVLLKELEDAALLEPIPYRATPRPPVIPDRVDLNAKQAVVFLSDIYAGPGLKGVPHGTVKKLRLFAYHYAHVNSGGHASVGVESSWDVKRILGTVPVAADGSALFTIPANMPISLQPLDEKGRALQLMRSWMVGMPGEVVSCTGCHEVQNEAPAQSNTLAMRRTPSKIEPWYGPARPFSFKHEVQPVLSQYCAGCHNGKARADGQAIPDFSGKIVDPGALSPKAIKFHITGYLGDVSYMALQKYVNRPGPESDYHLTEPLEYHASTSELMQVLEKGHHGVQLDAQAYDHLVTWIDLNAPHRGNWDPPAYRGQAQNPRRLELARLYASVDVDPEREFSILEAALPKRIKPVLPPPVECRSAAAPQVTGWPFSFSKAAQMQRAAGGLTERDVPLSETLALKLLRIPAGQFLMGSAAGANDEAPQTAVRITEPFWMSSVEITNAIYHLFDPDHNSRYIDRPGKDHKDRGFPANQPDQPVMRVTWTEAMAFCRWLSKATGRHFTLPTEAQWEWACRAGTDTPLWFGDINADFQKAANLADASALRAFTKFECTPLPGHAKLNDGQPVVCRVGAYAPNPWGLFDMHGNVAEWTRSDYRPYPYLDDDGRNNLSLSTRKVARGGSWRDRTSRCGSAFRLAYETWQPVANVGFRVICID